MKYVYCEFPFMSEPIEEEMSKEQAMRKFEQKNKALDKHGGLVAMMWFVGVQKRHNGKREWIVKRE